MSSDPVTAIAAQVGGSLIGSALGGKKADKQLGASNAAFQQALVHARQQAEIADELWQRNKEVYFPLEDELLDMADDFRDRTAELQGEASARANRQYELTRNETDRALASRGINPSSGMAASIRAGLGRGKAAGLAGEQTRIAREQMLRRDTQPWNRKLALLQNRLDVPNQIGNILGGAGRNAGLAGQGLAGLSNINYGRAGDAGVWGEELIGNLGGAVRHLGGSGLGGGMGPNSFPFLSQLGGGPKIFSQPVFADNLPAGIGALVGRREGGLIEGRGDGNDDANLAKVSKGEMIIPTDVVNFYGQEKFYNMINKVRQPKQVGLKRGK